MTDPLALQPMTATEVEELVRRVRLAMVIAGERSRGSASEVRIRIGRRSQLIARGVAQAARDLRSMTGVGVSADRALRAFHDAYPGMPIRFRAGSRCMEAARYALAQRITARAAGELFGLHQTGVAKALRCLRSA